MGAFFASLGNQIPGTLAQGLIWGVMALGLYLSFKILDFADLTVDSSFATGSGLCAILITKNVNPVLALCFSFAAGMLAGGITGLLNTKLKIPPILAGILTQLGLYSVNLHIMGGGFRDSKPNIPLLKFSEALIFTSQNENGAYTSDRTKTIIICTILCAALVAVMYWFFGTELGNAIRATGNNEHMARAMSINTNSMKVLCLMLSNGLVALSGALFSQYQGYADVNMGRGAIVIGLASIIIGEVLLGRFRSFVMRCTSAIVGSIIYYLIIAIVITIGLSTDDLKLFSAVVVAIALAVPAMKKKKAKLAKAQPAKEA